VPEIMVIPDTGSTTYNFYAYFYNDTGSPRDPDSNIVNLTIKNSAGSILSGPTAMTRSGQGIYVSSTSISSGATEQTQYMFFDFSVGSVALEQVRTSEVSQYQNSLDVLLSRLTSTRAANLDNLDATISSRASGANLALVPTNPLLTNDSRLNHLDADISSRVATADSRLSNLDVAVSSRASQASLNTAQSGISAIPTNPLLTSDARLNHLDADISSRAATSDSRFAFLDVAVSSRASQSSLDTDFGSMSAIQANLTTIQTALTALGVTLTADIATVSSDIGQCVIAADTAETAAAAAAAAATALDAGIVTLNSDISGLEDATAKLNKDAQVFATSNLTGAVSAEDALVGVVGS
jgi:hypothetical protein